MKRFYLPGAYKTPADYEIPPLEKLKDNTQHPELNSKSYRYEVSNYKPPRDYLQTYSCIRQNEDGLFILGTNDYTTCVLTGVLGGTYKFEDIVTSNFKDAKFSAIHKENLLNLYYLDNTTFIAATSSGTINLYSTKARKTLGDQDHREKFCFIMCNERVTDGDVNCLCVASSDRFIVGTSRGHFESYEHNSMGLTPTFTVSYGHSEEVTGIAANPEVESSWVSTSADKNCVLWDKRLVYPAQPLMMNHEDILTDVIWFEKNGIILSDSAGNVMIMDTRNPKSFVYKEGVIDRTISSLHYHDNKLGIISESTKALIYKVTDNKKLELLHEHDAYPFMLNSLCWDIYNKKDTFYVVGDEKYAKEITLSKVE